MTTLHLAAVAVNILPFADHPACNLDAKAYFWAPSLGDENTLANTGCERSDSWRSYRVRIYANVERTPEPAVVFQSQAIAMPGGSPSVNSSMNKALESPSTVGHGFTIQSARGLMPSEGRWTHAAGPVVKGVFVRSGRLCLARTLLSQSLR